MMNTGASSYRLYVSISAAVLCLAGVMATYGLMGTPGPLSGPSPSESGNVIRDSQDRESQTPPKTSTIKTPETMQQSEREGIDIVGELLARPLLERFLAITIAEHHHIIVLHGSLVVAILSRLSGCSVEEALRQFAEEQEAREDYVHTVMLLDTEMREVERKLLSGAAGSVQPLSVTLWISPAETNVRPALTRTKSYLYLQADMLSRKKEAPDGSMDWSQAGAAFLLIQDLPIERGEFNVFRRPQPFKELVAKIWLQYVVTRDRQNPPRRGGEYSQVDLVSRTLCVRLRGGDWEIGGLGPDFAR